MQALNYEALISRVSRVKQLLSALLQTYHRLPQLLERETIAIRNVDMPLVEQLSLEKIQSSQAVGEAMEGLQSEVSALHQVLAPSENESTPESARTISALIIRLSAACDAEAPGTLSVQVVRHLLGECARIHAEFQAAYRAIQPELEVQRELLTKRIANFRDSYRFWLGVEQEINQNYDRLGQRKDGPGTSMFQTKA